MMMTQRRQWCLPQNVRHWKTYVACRPVCSTYCPVHEVQSFWLSPAVLTCTYQRRRKKRKGWRWKRRWKWWQANPYRQTAKQQSSQTEIKLCHVISSEKMDNKHSLTSELVWFFCLLAFCFNLTMYALCPQYTFFVLVENVPPTVLTHPGPFPVMAEINHHQKEICCCSNKNKVPPPPNNPSPCSHEQNYNLPQSSLTNTHSLPKINLSNLICWENGENWLQNHLRCPSDPRG